MLDVDIPEIDEWLKPVGCLKVFRIRDFAASFARLRRTYNGTVAFDTYFVAEATQVAAKLAILKTPQNVDFIPPKYGPGQLTQATSNEGMLFAKAVVTVVTYNSICRIINSEIDAGTEPLPLLMPGCITCCGFLFPKLDSLFEKAWKEYKNNNSTYQTTTDDEAKSYVIRQLARLGNQDLDFVRELVGIKEVEAKTKRGAKARGASYPTLRAFLKVLEGFTDVKTETEFMERQRLIALRANGNPNITIYPGERLFDGKVTRPPFGWSIENQSEEHQPPDPIVSDKISNPNAP